MFVSPLATCHSLLLRKIFFTYYLCEVIQITHNQYMSRTSFHRRLCWCLFRVRRKRCCQVQEFSFNYVGINKPIYWHANNLDTVSMLNCRGNIVHHVTSTASFIYNTESHRVNRSIQSNRVYVDKQKFCWFARASTYRRRVKVDHRNKRAISIVSKS